MQVDASTKLELSPRTHRILERSGRGNESNVKMPRLGVDSSKVLLTSSSGFCLAWGEARVSLSTAGICR